ncbi:GTP 3',8-cyclase MoaA [Simiduia agarivorans]|uniref:GTP 3',8-cyclase n=1 Tax=Simiduia agarivorans (strain DSM 21679 / JCM 13881 / BCRC 17597 / SA1) TaxID=1117647 RepID=K4KPY3_SIMAS|nr:GTP 3',8-cyclase MoaA [Simiduia agarivorans]AFV00159.1 molybdenum cofactor biosynthesis protein A [Simiduia agarivorans SA1 = DSM 21679]
MQRQHPLIASDGSNRRFTYLRLSVTEACNFRCNYCLPEGYCPSTTDAPLSLSEIETLVQAFALCGTRKVRITGGEPTLRKDLAQIIQICKQTPGIEKVALTSNGYRLARQLPDYVNAGLDQLNLSADSLRPESFRLITGHDKLQQVLDALQLANRLGMRNTKLNTVLLKGYNLDQLEDFFNLVRHEPITLRFIELMNTGDNTAYYRAHHVAGQSIMDALKAEGWVQKVRGQDAGPAAEFTHPDYAGNVGFILPYSKNFCASCNRLRMSSHGKLHPCLFGDEGIDLRPLLKKQNPPAVAEAIHAGLQFKPAGHRLAEGLTGHTRHLAMLGG